MPGGGRDRREPPAGVTWPSKAGQRVVFNDNATVQTRSGSRNLRGATGVVMHARDSSSDWSRLVYWVPDVEGLRPTRSVGMGPDDWSSNAGQLRILDDAPEYWVDWGQACLWCYA